MSDDGLDTVALKRWRSIIVPVVINVSRNLVIRQHPVQVLSHGGVDGVVGGGVREP